MRTVIVDNPIESNISPKTREILAKLRRGLITDFEASRQLAKKDIYLVGRNATTISLSIRMTTKLGLFEIVVELPL